MGLSAKSKQTVFESKTITLNATGTVATGGTLSNPGLNPTITITTTKKLKLATFFAYSLTGQDFEKISTGYSDGTNQNCIDQFDVSLSSRTNCIVIAGTPTNGIRGLITAINNNSFDITFTIDAVVAENITCQMNLIEQ